MSTTTHVAVARDGSLIIGPGRHRELIDDMAANGPVVVTGPVAAADLRRGDFLLGDDEEHEVDDVTINRKVVSVLTVIAGVGEHLRFDIDEDVQVRRIVGPVLTEEQVVEIRRRIADPGVYTERRSIGQRVTGEEFETVAAWSAHAVQEYVDTLLSAAVEAERRRIRSLLQRAADGRDEYAAGAPQGMADTLVTEGQAYANAVRLCDDPTAILGLVPSWRWTTDENAAVRGETTIPPATQTEPDV